VRAESTRSITANLPLGVHVSTELDRPGTWGIEVQALEPGASWPLVSRVADRERTPDAGRRFPRRPAATARWRTARPEPADSDEHPDEDLYRLTIADADREQPPTLVLFGTPPTHQPHLRPVLELQGLKRDYGAEANFLHVRSTATTTFAVVPGSRSGACRSEPWLFLIDRDGRIAASSRRHHLREVEPAVSAGGWQLPGSKLVRRNCSRVTRLEAGCRRAVAQAQPHRRLKPGGDASRSVNCRSARAADSPRVI
jgi:hypothetical protein